jgi:hypothetical protein
MATMQAMQDNAGNVDAQITRMLLTVGEDMTQPIASGAFTPNGNNNTITTPMRAVGLTRGFILKITVPFTNNDTTVDATLTDWGAANIVSNFTMTDLDNYQRINTTGWHLFALNTDKEGFPFGSALLASALDTPVKMGNVFNCMSASGTIAHSGGTGTIQMYYWIPCSYGKRDLRGALYTGIVNSTGYIAFTVNPNFVSTAGDATFACYKQAAATAPLVIGNATWTLYQNYIDQIPRYDSGANKGQPILPPISMRTQYRLANTTLTGVQANNDFPIPFSNFQSFLSMTAIYDQNGTLNAGTDINAWKLAAANTLQFFYLDPITQALRSRVKIKTDWPKGSYLFSFREQPINTNQAGNMQILLNAASAAAQSSVNVGFEMFARVNAVLGAQSLPAG